MMETPAAQPRSSVAFISRNEKGCFINHQVLQHLKNLLPSGLDATVETGSGANAASFSALANSHTVFAATSDSERPASMPANVTWVPGPTALSLPFFTAHRSYDLIYLEGADAHPVPEAEYLFLRPYLKPGGFLLLGNLHLSTLARLADVIAEDEGFRVETLIGNCAVFRRTDETLPPEAWRSDRYNRRRLSPSHPDYLPGRPLADIFSALRLGQAASAPKDLSRLALVDIGHFLGQTHPACSAVRARLGSLNAGSPSSAWLKILDDSGADLQDVQVPPVKPDGVLVALDVPADRIDLFFRLRLEQLLRASPALHEAAFILIAPPDAAAPRRGLPPAGFVSRAGSSWPFEKTFFACPDRAGAALLTNTLGVPVHYISPAHAEDIARALAEGSLAEQGLFRSGASPGQRLAAQIQPMWGRCGSSTAFENELGALVAEGFFVLHLTVPDLSWAEFSPSLDANFRQRLAETTVSTAGHVAAYAGCAPEDRFVPNRTPDFAEAFALEVVGRARLSVPDSLVAMGLAQASIVIVNHITNIPLAVTQSPRAAILLDVHDDFTRSGYEKSRLDPPLADPVRCADLRWMRKAETALWRLADVCTNVNEHENKRVARWNDASMLVLPRPYVGRIDTISPDKAEYDALIVADIHPFNIRSLEWFLEEVWQPNDAVRLLRIAVVGRACNAIDSQRYNHPNLHLLGFVEDLDALRQRCLVSLAPDRAGTGVAVKVLTALYAGHPLVGTSIAFRGFPPEVRAAVPVHDIPSAFAQDLLALVSDAGARRQRIAEGDLACELLASAGFPTALRRALQHPRLNTVARKLATQGLLDALGPIHERLGGRRSQQVKVSSRRQAAADRDDARRQASELIAQIEMIRSSTTWRITWPLRALGRRLPGLARVGRRGLRLMVYAVRGELPQRLREWRSARAVRSSIRSGDLLRVLDLPAPSNTIPDPASIVLPVTEAPRVTVIIPTYGHVDHTLRCLASIAAAPPLIPFEVLVVEDASGDPRVAELAKVEGLRLEQWPQNLGFLRSCNAAAELARGDLLFFLNNDTEVMPGAIDALAGLLDRRPDAGMVGARLLYPDGVLQEAGGVIWRDGSAGNYGNRDDPRKHQYNYVREVDYCSGAAIMLPRARWEEMAGFDEFFLPAYCEDSDLAFRLRSAGWKVLYQPRATVIHYEGVSHGTDTGTGIKAHQVENTRKLAARWANTLATEALPRGQHVMRARDRAVGRKITLVIDHYVPEPDRDAGSRTMLAFMEALVASDRIVKFLPDNLYRTPVYSDALENLGIEVLHGPWTESLAGWISGNGADVDEILVSRPQIAAKYLPSLRQHCRAPIVFYGHDLHSARMRLEPGALQDAQRLEEIARMETLERNVWRLVDMVLYPSEEEAQAVRRMEPTAKVQPIQPYALSAPQSCAEAAPSSSNIIFIGGFRHTPNVDAAIWLATEILPLIQRERADAKLIIAGSSPTRAVLALARPGVEVRGFVSDDELETIYAEARVALCPLRFGAGVKLKVVEAMHRGVPVVTTTVGAQGLPDLSALCDVADEAKSLAVATLRLLSDDRLWLERVSAQANYVRSRFSLESMRLAVTTALADAERSR